MNNYRLPKSDEIALLKLGIDPIKCNNYQVLCLPENFQESSKNDLCDADDACDLYKMLKQKGVICANSYDLGIDSMIYIRKSNDIYFGLIWILNNVALPIFISVLYDWFKGKINNKNTIHIEIRLPSGKIIKHDGDVETLIECLEEESKV